MYQRLSAVLFPILAVALIGTGVWGYQEHQEKNSILIKAENQYQRAFHDLSYYMEQLNTELGKAMAVKSSSEQFQKRELIQVWRMTSQAQNQISQLPLGLLPFNRTEEFLSKIANFTYRASVRDLSKNPLSEEEQKTMQTLYDRSKDLAKDLRTIQAKVLKDKMRWMDVELQLASESKKTDNSIIDGFQLVDDEVGGYEELEWGPSVQSLYASRDMSMLSGKPVSEEEIRKKAADWLGLSQTDGMQVTMNGQGTEYSSISVAVDSKEGNAIQMDYSQNGGHLLWYMNEREVGKKVLTAEQASKKAEQFLKAHEYDETVPVNYDEFNHVSNITFAESKDGTIYYPRKITVKVALDNGEVIGLSAQDYVFEAKPAVLSEPAMTQEEASKLLSGNFQTSAVNKAYIKNDFNDKVLCYSFTGTANGGHYRIFLNADTGEEEKVETLLPVEADYPK
jgi:spore germination protein